MSKVANMINMVLYLTHHKRVKIKKLSEFLEIKPRMVRIYKNELEQAGIYIDSKKGKYGGYSLNQQKMIKNLGLNFNEINSLNMAEKYLIKEKSFPYIKEFCQGVQKINYEFSNVVPKSKKVEIKSKGKQNAYKSKEDNLLEKIYLAIIKKKKLKIKYYSLSSDETKNRIIHPYSVIFYSGFAYVIAYCEKRKKFLNFKVIRIREIENLNSTFKKDQSFNIKEIITPGYGFVHDNWIDIKLKIDFPKSIRVKEKIIVENQKIKMLDDKSIIFTAKMISKQEIISWILSLGSSVTILKPLSLKEEIKKELNNMIKNI
ncbi:MAG: helix-turn-helix transcriptional regulator [Bacillota bacterium]